MMLLTLALTLTLAPPQAARQSAPQTDETVAVQRGARLSVNNFGGEVIVRTWDRDSVRVVARHQPRTRVRVRPTGAGLSIDSSGYMGTPGSVDFEVTAPAWMPVKVEGTYNFITVEGTQAEISASTVDGDVTIKGGTGVVTAKSVQGEVLVQGARGKVNVSSVNERVRITDTSGDIIAESVNGPITMTGIDSKSVDATTVNGTITYEGRLADGGHYSFGTHNGDLLLGIADNANATFTVRTYNGSFSTDLPIEYNRADMRRGRRVTLTLGTGSADVSLESFGGGIRLRKGSVSTPRER
jgi:DUF4097 and DUF4098 domain-containing protein YvlB